MSHRADNLLIRSLRLATWLLAVLCLWMGTGGVLHHTDDLAYAASVVTPVGIGHATPPALPDDCAACEWTQGLQTGTPVVFQLILPLDSLVPYLCPLARPIPARPLLHRSPRAPPLFLS